jgi:hypothetical protein
MPKAPDNEPLQAFIQVGIGDRSVSIRQPHARLAAYLDQSQPSILHA